MVPPDQLALADEEGLHPGLVALLEQGDDVHVLPSGGDDLLLLADSSDGANLVSQHGCPLVVEPLGGFVHASLELAHNLRRPPFKEEEHLVDDGAVIVLVGVSHAGGHAAVDVVLQAWAGVRAGDDLGAGAIRKELLQQVQGATHGLGAGEGAEVAGAVVANEAGEGDQGELFSQVDLDVGVGLVVPQTGVVGGPVALDEGVFQDEGFALRVGDEELEVHGPLHHALDLGRQVGRLAEVGADPRAQGGGFAYIEESGGPVSKEVDPG